MITLYCDSSSDGFKITIIAQFGWAHIVRSIVLDFSEHKYLSVWHKRFAARTTVQRGVTLLAPAVGA